MEKSEIAKRLRNLPNLLTVSRILFVLIFVVLATIADKSFIPSDAARFGIRLGAYILAIIAGATDLLDGYLARRLNLVSDFGVLMDPLADKIFVTATMLIAVECSLMPAWIVIAVLCREFMVTGLRTLAAKKQVVISADRWGKLKTALQMLMLAVAGASWVWEFDLQQEKWFGIRLWYVWITYLCGIVLVTVGSGAGYFVRYRSLYLKIEEKTDRP